MKNTRYFIILAFAFCVQTTIATTIKNVELSRTKIKNDSTRIDEINQYWKELSRTVVEGDFEGYKSTYHEDAVIIFATGKNKSTIPLAKALAGWKQGFEDTKNGKVKSGVKFRFTQRIGDATTAHETGIFHYWSKDSSGKTLADEYVHFEMLMIKREGKWLAMMEYQKNIASEEEWKTLKK